MTHANDINSGVKPNSGEASYQCMYIREETIDERYTRFSQE